jgi:hypothetical protein
MPAIPSTVTISAAMSADRATSLGGGKDIDLPKVFDITADNTNFTEAKQVNLFFGALGTHPINLTEIVAGAVKAIALRSSEEIQVALNGSPAIQLRKVGTKPAAIMLQGDVTLLSLTTTIADTSVQIGILA